MARDIVQFVPFREVMRKSETSLVGLLVCMLQYHMYMTVQNEKSVVASNHPDARYFKCYQSTLKGNILN